MRILVGMPESGSQGGPVACEPPFVEELRKLGHDVDELVYAYADVRPGLPKRIARVRSTAKRFRDRMLTKDYDVILINTAFDKRAVVRDNFVLSCLPRGRGKIFLKFHGSDLRLLSTRNFLLRNIVRRVLLRADGIGVLSSEERKGFLEAGVRSEKVFLVKNAISDQEFKSHSSEDQPALPDVAANIPILLFISRFIPTKGLLDVINAGKLLRQNGGNFVLLCVGDGPERDSAEAKVKESGLTQLVRFTGYVTEETAAAFYSKSTMLVFPTYHDEGFPMVIFNALAAGLPIITTRIRAAADYLNEPANCLWVEAQNPEMLAQRIQELLSDDNLRCQMSDNNRSLSKQFTAQVVTPEYLTAFESLMPK